MKNTLKGTLMLILTAAIWGSAFVAQKSALDLIGPFTLQSVRSFLGALALVPFILIRNYKEKKSPSYQKSTLGEKKRLILTGIACGVILCTASCLQQIGLSFEGMDSGKAGFITAMYIILVPVCGIFTGRKISAKMWLCVVAAVTGLYLLCMGDKSGFSLAPEDAYVLLCAVVYTIHIIVIDKWGALVDGVKLSCIQFFVSGVLASVPMFIFEQPNVAYMLDVWFPIFYAGVMSCGVAYTLQILAQKHVAPTLASLLMSLESVFAVLSGALILNEVMSSYEYVGCILMFAAIMVSQLPEKRKIKKTVS